jgi:streptomycin 6-kinase
LRYEFPKRMVEHATKGWAEEGEAWLKELPDILDRCCEKWELTLGDTSEEIKANYIGYATGADGEDVVLKVGVPHRDFSTEMEALAIYDGRGINRLIDRDVELNAMLLERIRPGRMLSSIADKKAQATAAAHIMVDLQTVPPPSGHTLPHFLEWVEGSHEDAKDCDDAERAQGYLDQFPRVYAIMKAFEDDPQKLLHGDLHHYNILEDERRGWIAIDPKGVIGATCLDIGRFSGNTVDGTRSEKRQEVVEALEIFASVLVYCPMNSLKN